MQLFNFIKLLDFKLPPNNQTITRHSPVNFVNFTQSLNKRNRFLFHTSFYSFFFATYKVIIIFVVVHMLTHKKQHHQCLKVKKKESRVYCVCVGEKKITTIVII